MKYTLTITDATPEELAALIRNLPGNGQGTPDAPLTGTTSTPSASTAVPPMPIAPMPDAADQSDDDETGDAPAPDGAVDTDGLPWDARIHSAAKTQTKAGAWRKAKGADAATIAAVEAELRARGPVDAPKLPAPLVMPTMPIPLPAPVPMAMPTPEPIAPVMPTMPPAAPATPETVAPMMPPVAPVAPVAAPQVPTPQALDMFGFMANIQAGMQRRDANGAPVVHSEYLAQVTKEIEIAFGSPLTAITDISGNPAMLNYAMQILQRDGKWS